jgi:aryl-alcohol dehydrogenase-like predicted oxidoreductase
MEYRKIGFSDLELSVITFGAWAVGGWKWGGTNRKEAVEAIQAAYDLGVTSVDTAPVYGQGTSEEIVGVAIKNYSRDKVQILTKFGMRWDLAKGDYFFSSKDNNGKEIDIYKHSGKESIIKECEDSLQRLRTDYIDLYQIHWPDKTTAIAETMEALNMLVKQGKVRHAAVCNYNVEQVIEARKHVNIISNQVPYSMVRREIDDAIVPFCIENNISILAYSPLERGLLTGKLKQDHKFADGDHRADIHYFLEENIKRTNQFLDKIKTIALEKNASLSQIVLRWTIEQPGIVIALAGARNAEQAIQNAKAIDIKLTREEIIFINQELEKLELVNS